MSRFVAMLLLCLAALGSAPVAMASPAWLSPTDLSAPLRDSSNPEVAMDDAGDVVAVWERQEAPSHPIQASVRPAGGGFSEPINLSSSGSGQQVAMSALGEAIVVFTHLEGFDQLLQARVRPAGGGFSKPVTIATLAGSGSFAPRIAINAAGDAAVVWEDEEEGQRVARVSTRPAGGAFSQPVTVSDPEDAASEPEVAVDAGGESSVAWVRVGKTFKNEAEETIHEPDAVESSSGSGSSFGEPETVAGPYVAVAPDVAIDAQGEPAVVWQSIGNGGESVVETSAREPGGGFTPPQPLSKSSRRATDPRVAADPAGLLTIVWAEEEEEGKQVIESSSGSPGALSTPQTLSVSGASAVRPQVAVRASGTTIVWHRPDSMGIDAVEASTRPPGGSFSPPVPLSAPGENALFPRVGMDAAGDAVVVWRRSNGINEIVQAAGYDADAPALRRLAIPSTGTVGVPVGFSADPFDVWPIASTVFDFGDGSSAPGPAVSHTYSSPGTFRVSATAIDAAGTPTTASGTITISASNAFRIAKLKRNRKKGTATLVVEVPGPGGLALSGGGVKGATRRASAAGSVSLPVKPKRRTSKRLAGRGKAKLTVAVRFAPDGGPPATQRKTIVLIKKR